jgi:hypothetical protein
LWGEENSGLRVHDDELKIENGKWKIENWEVRVESGELKGGCGRGEKVENILRGIGDRHSQREMAG